MPPFRRVIQRSCPGVGPFGPDGFRGSLFEAWTLLQAESSRRRGIPLHHHKSTAQKPSSLLLTRMKRSARRQPESRVRSQPDTFQESICASTAFHGRNRPASHAGPRSSSPLASRTGAKEPLEAEVVIACQQTLSSDRRILRAYFRKQWISAMQVTEAL